MLLKFIRNTIAASTMTALALPAFAADNQPPIVFVHGDSDTAGLWMVQAWRLESNGYPRDHLYAVDIPHPSAQGDVNKAEPNRSSPKDAATAVAKMVDKALKETGAEKVVLVANSRGCQTSRNYVKNFGGADKVAGMVLAGCVHNGVFVAPGYAEGSEYNGAGTFLKALNEAPVIPEGQFVTIIRSDKYDLYSQPDGKFIGNAGNPTGANHNSPELEGADNKVLEGVDHRETLYSPQAFKLVYEAITGKAPDTTEIKPEEAPVLSGKISGFENDAPTNMPLKGAELSVFETDKATGKRAGDAVFTQTVGDDGRWGPFTAKPDQTYEFVVKADGLPDYHIFRSPFPRSTDIANIRLYPALEGEGTALGVMRPRGYFGPDDTMLANGKPFPGIDMDEPVPHVWKSRIPAAAGETVVAEFNGETIAGVVPDKDAVGWIELTY